MWGNDIRGLEQAIEVMVASDAVLLSDIFRPVVSKTMHFHAEGMGALCDFLTDPTEANQTDPFVQ